MIKKTSKLKKYGITQEDIARIFNYANVLSFQNSSAKERVLTGLEEIIEIVEEQIIDKLKE